jgi:uncharacterized protein YegL
MPKMMGMTDADIAQTARGFKYSNVKAEKLGASEYTITEIVVDATGSVSPFVNDLENMISESINACKKSPRKNNLLARVTKFNADMNRSHIDEIHGYTLLDTIDTAQYKGAIKPDGGTPLYEATLEAIETLHDYTAKLYKTKKITCNAIVFIITDGDNNASMNITTANIKEMIQKIKTEEILESIRTILIGINDTDAHFKARLEAFVKEAGLDEYISVGEVSAGKLAKLAQFVSRSTSSQAQAKGTGGPSQPISLKF